MVIFPSSLQGLGEIGHSDGGGDRRGKRGGEGHIKSLLWTMTDDPLCFSSDPVMDLKRRAPQKQKIAFGFALDYFYSD